MPARATTPQPTQAPRDDIARAVHAGLTSVPKRLPPWLFYDARGSALFEAITALPEYYLTRAERAIFDQDGEALMCGAMRGRTPTVIELGAGTSTKTEVLLAAAVARAPRLRFVPIDVSPEPLAAARARLARSLPHLQVTPWVATHEQAFARFAGLAGAKVVLFIGSSIGNYEHDEARTLLGGLRRSLRANDALVLGADLRKDAATMVAAYDDGAGVTADFNLNVLSRLNRELGADFDLARFRHIALWNEAESRIEMHLESLGDQRVQLPTLDLCVELRDRERIHTESSVKYDQAAVDELLTTTGFARERVFEDAERRFAVHLARAV